MNAGLFPENLTMKALPHSLLQPFVSRYIYRYVFTPGEGYIEKAMPFRLASSIDFFIGSPFETIDCHTGQPIPFTRCTIRGPRTCKKYIIRLRAHFISFTIRFHPTGLYRLLGIPMDRFADKAMPAADIKLLPFDTMCDRMLYAGSIGACIEIAEEYLLPLAFRSKMLPDRTEQIAQELMRQKGQTFVKDLATNNYLSARQLERNFKREIGVSPKTYSRMIRLHSLIQSKISNPAAKWSALAYEYNFFDQMHFIREFNDFLELNPSEFVPADFAF